MTLSRSNKDNFAEKLHTAIESSSPIEPLTETEPFSVDEAYEIQSRLVDRLVGNGEITGHKLGLVSEAKQEQLGIQEPIFGYVSEDTVLQDRTIPTDEMIAPRIEAEIGLVLNKDVTPPVATRDVLDATRAVVPVVEILESRYAGWSIPSAQDVIADNTSAGRVFVGETFRDVTDIDLAMESVVVSVNGEVEATGVGADIMGHPARAVSWLANRLADVDEHLEAGELVMTGGISAAIDIEPEDVYHIEFSNIGSIELRAE
ncbi:fumarylacetoacetate hydrolase family protein [Natronolimnohabitans sp. A-GB9]|uniref:2-keto-4-pentenoate hydratase n=1 Tax=Natronolimnohabitans sp. A-GB9 TaxID=3069757 RepID=UPI0027B6245D|nr:fumarylacetoacetate hydrolase family protein [Natronolimnohabitans sp. A-GB9]MDQ2052211.1 fumarylacetoacetate hydrolase family protein [Natronolimnohabitans sp. A-GB9]